MLPQSDCFAVQPVPGRGRGIVATRAVAAGELLVAEVAAAWLRVPPALCAGPPMRVTAELARAVMGDREAFDACAALEPTQEAFAAHKGAAVWAPAQPVNVPLLLKPAFSE